MATALQRRKILRLTSEKCDEWYDDVVIMYWYGVDGRRKILRLYRVGGTMAGGENTWNEARYGIHGMNMK